MNKIGLLKYRFSRGEENSSALSNFSVFRAENSALVKQERSGRYFIPAKSGHEEELERGNWNLRDFGRQNAVIEE